LFYCFADCVEQRGVASDGVIFFGQRRDIFDVYSVVKQVVFVVEQYRCYERLAFDGFLFFQHRIKSADGVAFQAAHRTAAVKNEY
jgi:hypothetical protein